jgi:hypothetical protein
MNKINIIEYNEGLRKSAIKLLEKVFDSPNQDLDFCWRFDVDNSEQYKPIIVCAIDSGKVISFNSWIKWLFKLEGKTYVGYQSGGSATDNQYRRMGIWGKTLRLGEQIAKERGYIDFFFGFPGNLSIGGLIKEKYLHIGTYDKNIRIINPFLFSLKEKETNRVLECINSTFLSQKDKLSPIIDSKYMEWRYHMNPKDYQIINYIDNKQKAIFMFRQSRYYNKRYKISFPEVQILDCHFTSYDDKFIHNSFKYIDRIYSKKAVWFRTFFNKATEKGKVLINHFHLNIKDNNTKLFLKNINLSNEYRIFINFDNWDLLPHIVDSE